MIQIDVSSKHQWGFVAGPDGIFAPNALALSRRDVQHSSIDIWVTIFLED